VGRGHFAVSLYHPLLVLTRSDGECFQWRTKGEYARLLHVVLRTCTVAVKDIRDVEHSIEVTAETLYEAIATALAALQQDNWVGEIGQGFATVTVLVQQPPVKHEVKMKASSHGLDARDVLPQRSC
jgi:hypothetical protein